jgi:hypothetical protein
MGMDSELEMMQQTGQMKSPHPRDGRFRAVSVGAGASDADGTASGERGTGSSKIEARK